MLMTGITKGYLQVIDRHTDTHLLETLFSVGDKAKVGSLFSKRAKNVFCVLLRPGHGEECDRKD